MQAADVHPWGKQPRKANVRGVAAAPATPWIPFVVVSKQDASNHDLASRVQIQGTHLDALTAGNSLDALSASALLSVFDTSVEGTRCLIKPRHGLGI